MDTKRYRTRWQLVEAVDDVFIAARVSSFTANSLHSPLSKMLVGGGDTLVSPVKGAYFAFARIKGNISLVQGMCQDVYQATAVSDAFLFVSSVARDPRVCADRCRC